jgi:hypothetical protein
MSAPLINDHPEENDGMGHYPISGGIYTFNNIFKSRPGASYESTNCHCGCTIFEVDYEEEGYPALAHD